MAENSARKTRSARTSKPTTTPAKPSRSRASKPSTPAKPTTRGKGASGTAKPSTRGAKTTPAKPSASKPSGPTPATLALAKKVSALRAKGTSWDDIAAETGKSLSTLAALRKNVRTNGAKFPNVPRF